MYSLQRILKTLETLFWNTIRGTGIGGDIYIMRLWAMDDREDEKIYKQILKIWDDER